MNRCFYILGVGLLYAALSWADVSLAVAAGSVTVLEPVTTYTPLTGALVQNTTEANMEQPVRDAGTFSKMYVYVPTNTVAATTTITLRKSRAATALTVSYTSTQTGIKEDTANSVSYANTDEADWQIVTGSSAGSTNIIIKEIGAQFTPTTTTDCVTFFAGANLSFSTASTTTFIAPNGGQAVTTTEANTKYRIRAAVVAQDFNVVVSANARTTDTVFGTRKNGADGAQLVTYTSTQTGTKEDTTHTDTLAAGDDYNYFIRTLTGTGTITARIVSSSLVATNSTFFLESSDAQPGTAQSFNTTRYYAPSGDLFSSQNATEINAQYLPRFTFTAKEFGAYVSANTIATSDTVVTFRDNTADGTQTFSYAAAQTGLKNDSVHTDTITSGTDEINYKVVTPNTSGSITFMWIGSLGSTAVAAGGGFNKRKKLDKWN